MDIYSNFFNMNKSFCHGDASLDNILCRDKIMYYRGSIQKIKNIPKLTKDIYKTTWEIKQKVLIDLASDRGVYIDQSQSLNIHMEVPTLEKLHKCHFYSWKAGLKTGSYYIRGKPAMNSQSFTIDPN